MTAAPTAMPLLTPRDAREVADAVRDVVASHGALRVRGAGTWMDAGYRVAATHTLSLASVSGVREYTPADLTISVGAGTTLAELDAVTREKGQWCPLLPWGDDHGTIGATLATATAGPCAGALGRARDAAIGLECVDGNARTIVAGGRVVKNVAGFDLVRLMTGQWGTLGVVTTVNLRLRARPASDESFVVTSDATRDDAMRAYARGPLAPLACELLTPRVADALDAPDGARWLVRIGGNAPFTTASREALAAVGRAEPVDTSVWARYRVIAAPARALDSWRWDALSRALKRTFDPHDVLNPGLLGGVL